MGSDALVVWRGVILQLLRRADLRIPSGGCCLVRVMVRLGFGSGLACSDSLAGSLTSTSGCSGVELLVLDGEWSWLSLFVSGVAGTVDLESRRLVLLGPGSELVHVSPP